MTIIKSFYILNVACHRRLGQVDYITKSLKESGIIETTRDSADLIILYTCAFTKLGVADSLSRIKDLSLTKKKDATLLVAGCLPKTDLETLRSEFDGPVMTVRDFTALNNLTGLNISPDINNDNKVNPGIVICVGCNRACTYCAIRHSVGPLKSMPLDTIMEEIVLREKENITCLDLRGDCLGDYGVDIGITLSDLLQKLIELDTKMTFNLLDLSMIGWLACYEKITKLCEMGRVKVIMLSLQSVNSKVLRAMGRGCDVKSFKSTLTKFRANFPNIDLRASFIAGFPTETDSEWQECCVFIKKIAFNDLNIYIYSAMPNTKASRMHRIKESVKIYRQQKGISYWREGKTKLGITGVKW